jgi:branched-chain amino acid aminotransferase
MQRLKSGCIPCRRKNSHNRHGAIVAGSSGARLPCRVFSASVPKGVSGPRYPLRHHPTSWRAREALTRLLQRPAYVFFEGDVRPWEEALFHISSEAVLRGLNVFEGIKGYWQHDGAFGLLLLDRHYVRLMRSARLLHIPTSISYEEFESACVAITRALYRPEDDLYLRAALYVTEGHYGENTVADLTVTAFMWPKKPPDPVTVGVSTWRRGSDLSQPPRIKSGANYQIARLARIEGRSRGYAEMLLLNGVGRLAEAAGACVLMVRDGQVCTPPPSEGAMESITVSVVAELCATMGIDFIRRPIERTELYVADEVALCGTLDELTLVRAVDDMALPDETPTLSAILERYRRAATGHEPHAAVRLTILDRPDDEPP